MERCTLTASVTLCAQASAAARERAERAEVKAARNRREGEAASADTVVSQTDTHTFARTGSGDLTMTF